MADREHLKILKTGVAAWNAWRREDPDLRPDLSGADLKGAQLVAADLVLTNLANAHLRGANLQAVNLGSASLLNANLAGANLASAHLEGTNLAKGNLTEAVLEGTDFDSVDLQGAQLARARMSFTGIKACDLSRVRGLAEVRHGGPSSIDRDTLVRSEGQIPKPFLQGCGFFDWEIEATRLYCPDLTDEELTNLTYEIHRLKSGAPILINRVFLSYSHQDSTFVDLLGDRLKSRGTPYWRDIDGMNAGPMDRQIDKALRLHPTVVLVLSKNSVDSDWVEWEVSRAREVEKELQRKNVNHHGLCPITLDDAWKCSRWGAHLRAQVEKYFILDFSEWRDRGQFDRQFVRLINGLRSYYSRNRDARE